MRALAGLRIGLVGPLPPPAGGMANQTLQLSELLRGAQARVSLVQSNAAYRPAWAGRLPMLRALFRLLPYLWSLWRTAGRSELLHVMANSGWSWHLFAAPAIWVGWLRRVPVVVNYRGGEAASFLAQSGTAIRWSMRRAAGLIVPSAFLQQVFAAHGLRAEVVPNIVDLQRFRPQAAGSAAPPHLLVARNLEAIYDNASAVHALARVHLKHPLAELTLAGTGPEETRLRDLAAELGLAQRVHFSGRLGPEQMAALLRAATVSLNTSLVDNMPNSVLEALASGVPVVSTHVGGVPFIVQDGVTALLVPPRDPEALAHAVLRLLDDPALAASLARAGLQEAQRYTWERVAPRLTECYHHALQRAQA